MGLAQRFDAAGVRKQARVTKQRRWSVDLEEGGWGDLLSIQWQQKRWSRHGEQQSLREFKALCENDPHKCLHVVVDV